LIATLRPYVAGFFEALTDSTDMSIIRVAAAEQSDQSHDGCCARAASGHAAAPPSRVMNSLRFIQ
jgi:hypothetical protein